jgi:hypothetical protein
MAGRLTNQAQGQIYLLSSTEAEEIFRTILKVDTSKDFCNFF